LASRRNHGRPDVADHAVDLDLAVRRETRVSIEFNASMVEFFATKDGTAMFRFLVSCRAEADRGVLPGTDS
jgi:hypothetical protein